MSENQSLAVHYEQKHASGSTVHVAGGRFQGAGEVEQFSSLENKYLVVMREGGRRVWVESKEVRA